jgi:hypothetical protein
MSKPRLNRDGSPVQPMTLGNMRELGVTALSVTCLQCSHRAVLDVRPWPDDVVVPWFGPRMVCTGCGMIGADARPNWKEQHRWRVNRPS